MSNAKAFAEKNFKNIIKDLFKYILYNIQHNEDKFELYITPIFYNENEQTSYISIQKNDRDGKFSSSLSLFNMVKLIWNKLTNDEKNAIKKYESDRSYDISSNNQLFCKIHKSITEWLKSNFNLDVRNKQLITEKDISFQYKYSDGNVEKALLIIFVYIPNDVIKDSRKSKSINTSINYELSNSCDIDYLKKTDLGLNLDEKFVHIFVDLSKNYNIISEKIFNMDGLYDAIKDDYKEFNVGDIVYEVEGDAKYEIKLINEDELSISCYDNDNAISNLLYENDEFLYKNTNGKCMNFTILSIKGNSFIAQKKINDLQ